jgi:hypothetical protein
VRDGNKNGRNPWRAPLEFATHIFVATLVFVLIASAALCLKVFVGWVQGLGIAPKWMLTTLEILEYGLFLVDVVTFSVYVLVETWSFLVAVCRKVKQDVRV